MTGSGTSAWTSESPSLSPLPGARILIVEDETGIVDFLERGLRAVGCVVEVALDGDRGQQLAVSQDQDLVLLDRLLPRRDGIEVLRAIRRVKPLLPVILLTRKAAVADRVEGLELGAADYVTKPFSFDELLARIQARLRESTPDVDAVLEVAGIRLDRVARTATRGGQTIQLPERESDLLAYLMRRAGRCCSRAEILSAVWNYDHDPGTNVVQVYIGYLRRKLSLPDAPAPIVTVRSTGYRLNLDR